MCTLRIEEALIAFSSTPTNGFLLCVAKAEAWKIELKLFDSLSLFHLPAIAKAPNYLFLEHFVADSWSRIADLEATPNMHLLCLCAQYGWGYHRCYAFCIYLLLYEAPSMGILALVPLWLLYTRNTSWRLLLRFLEIDFNDFVGFWHALFASTCWKKSSKTIRCEVYNPLAA